MANTLGPGFLEKVYENALAHELRKLGLSAVQQQGLQVHYDGVLVGDFVADIVVDSIIIFELKATKDFTDFYAAQCLNYLKATKLSVCLLLNFGKAKLEVRRYERPNGIFSLDEGDQRG